MGLKFVGANSRLYSQRLLGWVLGVFLLFALLGLSEFNRLQTLRQTANNRLSDVSAAANAVSWVRMTGHQPGDVASAERNLKDARNRYAQNVAVYNGALRRIPGRIVARMFRFNPLPVNPQNLIATGPPHE